MAEQVTLNHLVVGSSPIIPILYFDEMFVR
jgi:hypothetical protein